MEFGGYLSLELKRGDNYFEQDSTLSFREFNSGRGAIVAALEAVSPSKVFVPYYNCHYVEETLIYNGFTIERYFLDDSFFPILDNISNNEWILYIDYFGLCNNEFKNKIVLKYKNVIFDNTQSFYALPIQADNVFNVYSCRKFFGTSDGAYLVWKNDICINKYYEKDISWERCKHLLKSIETGTNSAYQESLESENQIGYTVKEMSLLTKRIMQSIDYVDVREKRIRNFKFVHEHLHDINEMKISMQEYNVPMIYPLVVSNAEIRYRLIEEKIYIPQWWKYLLEILPENTIEYRLSKYLLPLPIDQRYSINEIEIMINRIKNIIN